MTGARPCALFVAGRLMLRRLASCGHVRWLGATLAVVLSCATAKENAGGSSSGGGGPGSVSSASTSATGGSDGQTSTASSVGSGGSMTSGCATDNDCKTPEAPHCDMATSACVGCTAEAQCGMGQYCD